LRKPVFASCAWLAVRRSTALRTAECCDGAIDALWVQPAAGDAGGALGAALAAYHEFLDQPRRVGNVPDGMQGAYLGLGPCSLKSCPQRE